MFPLFRTSRSENRPPIDWVSYENGTIELFDYSHCLYYDGENVSRTLGSTDRDKWDSMLQQYFGLQQNDSQS